MPGLSDKDIGQQHGLYRAPLQIRPVSDTPVKLSGPRGGRSLQTLLQMEEAAMRCSGGLIATEALDKYIAARRREPNPQARALGTAERRQDKLPDNDFKAHRQLQPSCFPPARGTAAASGEPSQNSAACSEESLPNASHFPPSRDGQDCGSGVINVDTDEPIDVDAVLARWQQEHIMSQEAAETKAAFNPAPVPSKQRPLQSKETTANPSGGTGTPKEDLPAELPEGHPAAASLGSPLAEANTNTSTSRVPASRTLYRELRTPLAKNLLRCLASNLTSDVDLSLSQGEDGISSISNSDEENCSPRPDTPLSSPSASVDAAFPGPVHKHGTASPGVDFPTVPNQQESRPGQEHQPSLPLPPSPAGPEAEAATPGRKATAAQEEEELEQAAAEGAMRRGALLAADIRLMYPHLFQGCPSPQPSSSSPTLQSAAEEPAGGPREIDIPHPFPHQ